jgi:hypothetical protein
MHGRYSFNIKVPSENPAGSHINKNEGDWQ